MSFLSALLIGLAAWLAAGVLAFATMVAHVRWTYRRAKRYPARRDRGSLAEREFGRSGDSPQRRDRAVSRVGCGTPGRPRVPCPERSAVRRTRAETLDGLLRKLTLEGSVLVLWEDK